MNTLPKRIQEYIKFSRKYKKILGPKGNYRRGEIEIIENPKLFLQAEESAAKQMMSQGISKKEALERGKIGIRERNRWGISVCEPVRLPPKGVLGTFVRFIPWGQLGGEVGGVVIIPVDPKGRIMLLKNFRHATRTWSLELPRGTKDPGESIKTELKEEGGARFLTKPKKIGQVTPDSGVLATKVDVYFAHIEVVHEPSPQVTEAIRGVIFLAPKEVKKAIRKGKYKEKDGEAYVFLDAFTISVFALASEKGLI